MSEISVRRGVSADVPVLKALWSCVFGDPDADIDAFFETFFDDGICVVAESGKMPAAMGFLLPVGFLRVPDEDDVPCGMIYAVATEPSMRKLGCGAAVTRRLLDAASTQGMGAVVLHPAEDSLFEYYNAKVGMETTFFCTEERIQITPRDSVAIRRVSAAEYVAIRKELLRETPHITFNERCFNYQERLCGEGGLFATECEDGGKCCAAVEVSGGDVRIIELLGDGEKLLQAVAKEFPAEEYLVRRPGENVRFGMINRGKSIESVWFGPAFD